MEKAITWLVINRTFYGTLLVNVDIVPTPSIQTAATDGARIYYNPDFIRKLPTKQKAAVLAHEALHILFGHCLAKKINKKKFNAACDYVVNETLKKDKFELPEGILLDSQYFNMTEESIYKILPDSAKPESEDLLPANETEAQNATERLNDISSKLAGAFNEEAIYKAEIKRSDMALAEKLKAYFIEAKGRATKSWIKPNKALLAKKKYLPSKGREKKFKAMIGIDVSGSINQHLLDRFLSAVESIRVTIPSEINVVQWATTVRKDEFFNEKQKLNPDLMVGGGTDANCIIDYYEKSNSDLLLVFTDMCFYPPKHTRKKVVWVTENKFAKPPYGIMIQMKGRHI